MWVGTSSQIFGARWDSVSEPYVTHLIGLDWNILQFLVLYERLLFKRKISFIISLYHYISENPFTILYNSVAVICIILWCAEMQFPESLRMMMYCHCKLYEDTFQAFYWFAIKLSAMEHPRYWTMAKCVLKNTFIKILPPNSWLFLIFAVPKFTCICLLVCNYKWHLLSFPWNWLPLNHLKIERDASF